MFEARKRAGCSRLGILSGEGWELATPNILHPGTSRARVDELAEAILERSGEATKLVIKGDGGPVEAFDIPAYSGMPSTSDSRTEPGKRVCVIRPDADVDEIREIRGQIDLFILENSIELYKNTRIFIDTLVRVREAIGYQSALYLPAVALPHNLAVLVYLGADLLDPVRVAMLTRQEYFLSSDGCWPASELRGEGCSCAACADAEAGYGQLLGHNMLALHSELHGVRTRIARGELREFTEYRAKTSPGLVEMLRHLDKRYFNFQEQRFPVVSKGFRATTRLSLDRPDVKRFRERMLSRYRKPATPSILVLLPCSARKPYSSSRSHGLFRRAIRDSGAGMKVHELMVTSPIGLVPRELELFYPAQHYDIPVTGHWYEDEKRMINHMLEAYVSSNQYDLIINHLGDEAGILDSVDAVVTAEGHPTGDDSLAGLTRLLSEHKDENASWRTRSIEEISSIARFQFGEGADQIFEGCNVRGRYPSLRVFKGKEQLASLSKSTGQLIPTLEGARPLAEKGLYCVHIFDFEIEGNLFAVGVESASPEIRTGDEVAVLRGDEVVAAGTARMSALEMEESDRGEAVRIRHRVK